jgi:CHAT domain-containing protein/tetratricopeptide (TPR) repeat protein
VLAGASKEQVMRAFPAVQLGLIVLMGLLLPWSLSAGEVAKNASPDRPPWQRYLQGEDARKAAEQEKDLAQLQEAGRLMDALQVAEALAEMRGKVQGADHWQAVSARAEAEALRRVLRQPEQGRKDYGRSLGLRRRATELLNKGRSREAQPLLENVLAVRRKILGEEHPDTATGYNNLAYNLNAQGKYAAAEEGFLKALAIRRKALGEDHPDTAGSYTNLAANQIAQGKYAEAEEGHRKALAIYCKILGEEHPNTATSYNTLASNQNAQGKYAAAEESYRKALAIRRKILGEDHLDTAASYNNLAANQHNQGKYATAEEGFLKALAIRRKILGEEHPHTANSYNSLGVNLNAQGKYAQAEEGVRKALAIRRKVLGEEHPATANSYHCLALNQHEQGKYAQAEEGVRKALAIRCKVLGEEHHDTAMSYISLAYSQAAQGKYKEAEEGFRKALAIQRKVFGEEHPHTALSYNSLALLQNAQGKYALAEEGIRKALAIRRKALGEEHPHTASSYFSLALNQHEQGKYAQAEEGYRKALDIQRKVLGEEHPETARSYHNLAANQHEQGKYAAAEEGYRKALAIKRKVLDKEHPDTILSCHNLAVSQQAQGKYAAAEEDFRKALAISRKVLGEEHPDTATCYKGLAFNQEVQGKYAAAEALWLQAASSFARARLRIAPSGLERAIKTGEGSPLPHLAAVLARNGKPEEAWRRFEEALARGTWDDLSARLRRPAAEQAKQADIVNRLDRLDRLIESTFSASADTPERKARRDHLLTRRRQVQEELDAFAHHLEEAYGPAAGQVFGRKQIQKALPADAALIGWLDLPGDPHMADPNGEYWAVLLRRSGEPMWVRLPGSGARHAWTDADAQLPGQLLAALQSAGGKWQPLAKRLGEQRLGPLAGHLDGVRRLVVLPAPALAGVPVEVFAEGYTVSYALSGTLYAHLRDKASTTSSGLLALADPVFDAPDLAEQGCLDRGDGVWKRLPGTRFEVAALQRLFGEREPTRLLLDSQASEQRLHELAGKGELGKYRYLHLATHGEVDDAFPLRSALILSRDGLPDEKQRVQRLQSGEPIPDGRLTAREVLEGWHLDCDLVTLSACQTALGRYERGEGFVGFAQALILAGSRSVCLSLWKVDDIATALLMQRFYQNLLGKRDGLKGQMPRAEALAEAKAWLRSLPREEAVKRAARLGEGVLRGKGRPVQPLLVQSGKEEAERPYAHPYYWAAFVLIGQPD